MNRRELRLVRLAVMLGALIGCIGCGDNTPADPCDIIPGDTIGYQQCSANLSCVASCGVLPPDGSPGHLLPAGCHVQIGASTIVDARCVATCGECAAP